MYIEISKQKMSKKQQNQFGVMPLVTFAENYKSPIQINV